MIEAKSLVKYFNDRAVLNGVSFTLAPGEVVGLIGPSGGGKSVLLKILGNVFAPDSGTANVTGTSKRVSSVGYLFQEGGLFDSMTVLENTAFPLLSGGADLRFKDESGEVWTRAEALDRALAMLDEVGLSEHMNKVPGQLSGGMRRRAGIARALVAEPELVLLDDPTGGLDPVTASVILDLIADLHQRHHCTLLMVSHDLRRLLPRVERIIALMNGAVCYDGVVSALLSSAPRELLEFIGKRYDFSTLPNSEISV